MNKFDMNNMTEDEKIRKALLNFMTIMWGNSQDDVCGVHVEDAIAWLEKQGAQKSVYVATRSEEHSDYVEAVSLSENKAEKYCKPYNENADCYARNITKIEIQ